MMEQNINSPLTSSCGRLFDAVAALIGVRDKVNYEAQAAIELEMAIHASPSSTGYPLSLSAQSDGWVIGTRPLFEAILVDLKQGVLIADMSRLFHNGLIHALVEIAERIREEAGLRRVCLSGGTFNNSYLSRGLGSQLLQAGFEVFAQNEVPAGDGGLSLGQAMVAAHRVSTQGKQAASVTAHVSA